MRFLYPQYPILTYRRFQFNRIRSWLQFLYIHYFHMNCTPFSKPPWLWAVWTRFGVGELRARMCGIFHFLHCRFFLPPLLVFASFLHHVKNNVEDNVWETASAHIGSHSHTQAHTHILTMCNTKHSYKSSAVCSRFVFILVSPFSIESKCYLGRILQVVAVAKTLFNFPRLFFSSFFRKNISILFFIHI